MVIKSNSVRDINVALLELERRIKTNKDEDNDTLQEAVNYVKKYLNNHLNDGSTYNINISGNANTADYAISAGTSNYATSAGSAQSADTANNATHATNADYATSAGSATSAGTADVAKGLPFGTCDSLASDVAKTATVSPAITTLTAGTTVAIKMTNTNNASNATLNVNGTGAYLIKRYGTTNAGTNGREAWQGGVIQLFTFDGTYWYLDDFRQNAQYALTAERAYGSGLCNTAADTADKIGNLYSYTLQAGSTFTLYFNIANTAASALTLNMNSTGAKPIYINGVASSATNYTIPKGTYFVTYNGTYYNVQTAGPHAITADYATTAGGAAITFPEGYVYFQLYNPTTASWEGSPNDLNLQVPAGYKWTEITANFASYPYLKIGSGTTQSGRVLNHTHGMQHHHSMRHRHSGTTGGASMYGGWDANAIGFWYNIGGSGSPSIYNLSSANYRSGTATINHGHGFTTSNNTAAYADTSDQESRFTSGAYSGTGTGTTGKTATDGNASANTTNEVNASNVKVWKVVQDI